VDQIQDGDALMKKFVMIFMLIAGVLYAEPYKAVLDCTSSDARYMLSRMMLMNKTAQMVKEAGEKPEFILVFRGGATPMMAKRPDDYIDDKDLPVMKNFRKELKKLVEMHHAKVLGCEIAMEKFDLKKEEVLPFIETTPNSFLDLISLQNRGYALIGFNK
jgi:intracellular sulfur oxidation DsrE/DsrF family protein